jgi:hypothetical protein
LIRYYATDHQIATQTSEIAALTTVSGNRIAQISPLMSCDQTWDLDAALVPFARCALGSYASYSQFKTAVGSWLLSTLNLWDVIDRQVGALLRNPQPADFAVNDALIGIEMLQNLLLGTGESTLEYAINLFQMRPVQELTTVIRALREKGADRAVDVLLEGRFSDFFGMDMEDVSYATHLLKSARDVAREDMPVRKTERADRVEQRSLGSAEGPDFEYSKSDIDESPRPDNKEGI